jgi:acyl dehydratase
MTQIRTLDDFERAYRDGLGKPLPLRPWRTITEEYIGRLSNGVGDYNPLYRNAAYASAGRFHTLVATPALVTASAGGTVAAIWGNIPQRDVPSEDLTMLYAGAEVEWFAPMYAGDRIRVIERPFSVERISTRQLPNALLTTGLAEVWNSRSELVATVHCQMIRFENKGFAVESTHDDAERPQVRVAPDPLVHQRVRRGGEPRYWASVTEGEAIPELPKGTYTQTELYAFSYGSGGATRVPEMEGDTIDMGAGGRADPEYARKHRGQASTFDFGFQRICWLTQAATDWMGDHGDLVRLKARIRRPNLLFDTNTIYGRVARKYRDGDHGLVDVEIENRNQRDEVTATATATVRLPDEGGIEDHDLLFTETGTLEVGVYG